MRDTLHTLPKSTRSLMRMQEHVCGATSRVCCKAAARPRRSARAQQPSDHQSSSWAHRAPMEAKLDEFDWFLYAEDDTFVPIAAMRQQLRLAEPLYREQGKLLSFARVANDSKGKLYCADLGSRQNVSHHFRFRDMSFGSMTFSFAASWAYPKRIMRDFVRSEQWRVPVDTRDLRASAGWGYVRPEMCSSRQQTIQPCQGCPGCAVLPYPSPDAAVYHLTQCEIGMSGKSAP